jgi:hypothetical protein
VTISLLLGGLNNVFLFSSNYVTTKSGFDYTVGAVPHWWNCNWSYVKKITIDHTKVQGDQENFPVLLYQAADADLAAHAQDSGFDLVFTDRYNLTQYSHELEKFDGDTGELWAWVRFPSLSSTQDTIVYLYYGNPSCGDQQHVAETWDANYMMVQHLQQSSGAFVDSTVQSNDGTGYNGVTRNVIGKVDGAVSLDGIDDYIDAGTSASLNVTNQVTLEGWVKDPPLSYGSAVPLAIANKQEEQRVIPMNGSFMVERTVMGNDSSEVVFAVLSSPGVTIKDLVVDGVSVFAGCFMAGKPGLALEQRVEGVRRVLPDEVRSLPGVAYSRPFTLHGGRAVVSIMCSSVPMGLCALQGRMSYLLIGSGDRYDVECTTHWVSSQLFIAGLPFLVGCQRSASTIRSSEVFHLGNGRIDYYISKADPLQVTNVYGQFWEHHALCIQADGQEVCFNGSYAVRWENGSGYSRLVAVTSKESFTLTVTYTLRDEADEICVNPVITADARYENSVVSWRISNISVNGTVDNVLVVPQVLRTSLPINQTFEQKALVRYDLSSFNTTLHANDLYENWLEFRDRAEEDLSRTRWNINTSYDFEVVPVEQPGDNDIVLQFTTGVVSPGCPIVLSLRWVDWRVADTSANYTINGTAYIAFFSQSVAMGDFNGDGKADALVGAYKDDVTFGKAYIFFGGSPTGNRTDANANVTLKGTVSGGYFGYSVAMGDFNNDGKADALIGAYYNASGGTSRGSAKIFFGGTPYGTRLATAANVTFDGTVNSAYFGCSVAMGDFNSDGKQDALVGAYNNGSAPSLFGCAKVFFGGTPYGRRLATAANVTFDGTVSSSNFGYSVAMGDFNGDSKVDALVGASNNGSQAGTGCAKVFFGGTPYSRRLATAANVTFDGTSGKSYFGCAVALGDFNGDSKADALVGAYNNLSGGTGRGCARIFFGGSPIGRRLATAANVTFDGTVDSSYFGYAVAMGDFNGDSMADALIGAYGNGSSGGLPHSTSNGCAKVFYSGTTRSQWPASAANVTFDGTVGAQLGWSVALGDFNNDGKADALVGANMYHSGEGDARVFFGGTPTGRRIDNSSNVTFDGTMYAANLGISSAMGDFNGDGKADAIVGAFADAYYEGKVYIFFGGSPAGRLYDYNANVTLAGTVVGSYFGNNVTTGDFNGDGKADVLVGVYKNASGGTSRGCANIFFGGPPYGTRLATAANVTFDGTVDSAAFGRSVAMGDFNYDGEDDALIGASLNSSGGTSRGCAKVFFGGSPYGTRLATAANVTFDGTVDSAFLGCAVAMGDFNGDSYKDALVGASNNASGGSSRGCAKIFFGGSPYGRRLATAANVTLDGTSNLIYFGNAVAMGDFNGDGKADALVGIWKNGTNYPGCARIFYGGSPYGRRLQTASNVTFDGTVLSAWFGWSVAMGDVNGDGKADALVGAYANGSVAGSNRGCVKVFYGQSGTSLRRLATAANVTYDGTASNGYLSYSVAVGDMNNNGKKDVLAGVYGDNSAEGKAVVFYDDSSPPSSSVTSISPYWKTTTATISATATDTIGDVKNVTLYYRYSSNNASWGGYVSFGVDTASPWSWSFTFPNSTGYYQFYSIAKDYSLNTEAAPGSADSRAGYDPSAPSSSVTAITTYWRTSSPLTIAATASDTGPSGVKNVTLYYRYSSNNASWGGYVSAGVDTASPWSWSFTFTNGSGFYQFYSLAKDNATNTEAAPGSADTRCGYDITEPSSSVDTITPYWKNTAITITATASDATSGVKNVTLYYRFSSDNASWGGYVSSGVDTASPWSWSFSFTNGTGYYQFYSIAKDNVSNAESAPGSADARSGYDTTAPTSAVDAIIPYWKNSAATFTVTASDATSGVKNVTLYYRYSTNNASWGSYVSFGVDSASPWSWSFTFTNGSGFYQFYSIAKDNATNTEATPGTADTIGGYDIVAPSSSVTTITSCWITSQPKTLAGTASDNGGCGLKNVSLWWRFSNNNASWDGWTNGTYSFVDTDPWVSVSWSFTFPNGTGYYQFYSRARDNLSNIEAAPGSADAMAGYDPSTSSSSVDAITPYWKTSSPITVTATATDTGPSGVKNVTLYYLFSSNNASWGGNTSFGVDTASPWSWSFTFTNGTGYYQFYSIAKDNASNTELAPISADAFCGYDTIAPTSSVTSILPYWNKAATTVTAFASDATSGVKNVTLYYRFSSDNASWGGYVSSGVDTASPWSWSFSFTNGTGYYQFYTIAKDNATNTESAPGTADANSGYDTTTPISAVDTITTYWKKSAATITASASDATSGVKNLTLYYRYSANNASWDSYVSFDVDTASPWSWSFTFTNGTGYYQFYSIAKDNATNSESAPGTADTIGGYDSVAPTSSVNAIAPYWINGATTITAAASDAASGVKNVTLYYRFSSNNGSWGGWVNEGVDTASPWSWSFTFSNGTGYYQFYSIAKDNATNSESIPGSADAQCGYDTTAPISSVTTVSSYWKNTTTVLTATASDATSGVKNVTLYYRFSNNNASWSSNTSFGVDTASPWSWSFTFTNGTGYYQFYSIAIDNATNTEAAPGSADTVCGYDNVAPSSSVDTISPYWRTSSPLSLSVTANDALSGVKNVTLWYRFSNDNNSWGGWVSGGVDAASPWSWSFSFTNGSGHYQFYSIAKDNATNTESTPGSADALCGNDTIAPSSSVTAITPYWKTATATISATASDAMSGVKNVTLYYRFSSNNASWGGYTSAGTDSTSPWSWSFTFTNGTGYYQFYSIAKDNATNTESAPGSADTIAGYDSSAPSSAVSTITTYWKTSQPQTLTGSASDTGVSGLKNVTLWWRYSTNNASWGGWTNGTYSFVDTDPWVSVSWSFTFSNGSGFYQFYSRARDNATNTEVAPGTADTMAGFDTTASSSSVNAITPYWKATSPTTITATASDGTSGVKNVTLYYRYSLNNASWGGYVNAGVDTASPWSWSMAFSNGSGFYQFYSIAKDNATNTESTPGSADALCGYDNQAPASSVNTITPHWKTTSPTTITATATDVFQGITLSGVKNVSLYYRYSANNASWGGYVSFGVDSASPWSWSFTFSNGTGYYQFYSIAKDNATNVESPPGRPPDTFCGYDNVAPSSSVNAITPYWKTSSPLTITATASDATSGVKNVTLYYRFGTNNVTFGGWVSGGVDTASPWSWSFSFPNGTGRYQFYSIAKDYATNVESAPTGFTPYDQICGYDNVAPTSSVNSISPYWKTSSPTTITATASDATSGVKNVTLYYRYSGDNLSWGGWTHTDVQWAKGPTGAGSDWGRAIAVDSSGNIYITGYHTSGLDFGGGITVADEAGVGMFVAKYNSAGVVQWATGPTGAGDDYGRGIGVDSSGNVYIGGYQTSGLDFGGGITVADEGGTGIFLVKYNSAGVVQWATGPSGTGNDQGRAMAVDSSGNSYITGYDTSGLDFGGGITVADEVGVGMFVAKYNSAGVVQWATGPTGGGDDYGYGTAVDSSGNVYVTGYHTLGLNFGGGVTVSDETNDGLFTVKFNSAGAVQWASGPTGAGNEHGQDVAVDSSGNVYVVGYHTLGMNFGGGITVADEGSDGVFVVKYNSVGVAQWAAGPVGAGQDEGYGIALDSSNSVYLTGYQESGLNFGNGVTVADEGSWGVFVAKYSTAGVIEWAVGPSGSGEDVGLDVVVDSSNNFYVVGYQSTGLGFAFGISVADEGIDGIFVAKYNGAVIDPASPWSWSFAFSNGTGYYQFYSIAKDNATNTESAPGGPGSDPFDTKCGYDNVAPSSTVDSITTYWQTTSPLTITATASDTGPSGLKNVTLYYSYSSNNASWGGYVSFGVDTASPWSWSFSFSNGTGWYRFYSIAKDNATNAESLPDLGYDTSCGYDNVAPSSAVDAISPYWQKTSPLTITATASDATSGVKNVTLYYRYTSNNASWGNFVSAGIDIASPWSWSFTFPNGTGYYQFYSIAKDKATNAESPPGGPSNFDTSCGYDNVAPVSSVNTITPYWQDNTPVTISATASDALSGVKNVTLYYRYSANNASWGGYVNAGTDTASPWSWSFSFTNGTGYYQFYSIAKDNATNTESAPGSADTIAGYDSSAPSSAVSTITTYWKTSQPQTLTGTASDTGVSGLKNVTLWWRYSTNNASWGGWTNSTYNFVDVTPWSGIMWNFTFPNSTGYYQFYSIAKDNATNTEAAPGVADARCGYDTTAPTSSVSTIIPYLHLTAPLTLNGTASDTGPSGLKNVTLKYRYSTNNGSWSGWTNSLIDTTPWSEVTWNYTFPNGTGYYQFYSIAKDNATNTETAPGIADTSCRYLPVVIPTVVTNTSTGVKTTNATLHGFLQNDGGEACTVRFIYGPSETYGTNTTNQTKATDTTFQQNISGLNPGQYYHYQAYANNTVFANTGVDLTFLTKPNPPASLTSQANSSTKIYLTWTKGTGANTTRIQQKTGGYPTSITDGTNVYNQTSTYVEDTGLTPGTTYYYRAWSYTPWDSLHQWSETYANTTTTTKHVPILSNENPTNGSTGLTLNTTLSIELSDHYGYPMTITWYWGTNTTPSSFIGTNTSMANGTHSISNDGNFSSNSQTYYWRITVSDGHGEWTNATYHFSTIAPNKKIISKGRDAYALEINPGGTTLTGYINNQSLTTSIDTNWHYVSLTYDGTHIRLYKDGTLQATTNTSGSITTTTNPVLLGESLSGNLDELRLSTTARTQDWLNTTYHNTNAPTTFATFGTETGSLTQWHYRKPITIDHTKIPDTQTDFPVLINLPSDADLRDHAQNTGNDILFTASNIDWTTGTWRDALSYELEKYDPATGALTAWVKIPTLTSDTDTTLYMYYNCTVCTTDRSTPTNVWNDNFCGVWHMTDTTTSTISDSTTNHNNGTKTSTNNPLQIDGKIDGSQQFDGTDGITIPTSDTLNPMFFTLEYWLKNTPPYHENGMIRLTSRSDDSFDTAINSSDNKSVYFYDNGDATWYDTGFDATPNTWYHLTWVYNGFAVLLYVNGTYTYGLGPQIFTTNGDLEIGTSPTMNYNLSGILDEIRLSTSAFTNEWITTNFNTMNSSATFFTLGSEQRRNHPPAQSIPSPLESATDVPINPTLSIKVNDQNADTMDITLRTNATGTWTTLGTNTSVTNGTYRQMTTTMNNLSTTYYWSVNATDGETWTNITYSFTTTNSLTLDATPDDGWLKNTSAVYNAAQTAANGTVDTTNTTLTIGQDSSYRVARGFLFFNTSNIPDSATISSVTLRFYGASDSSNQDFAILVYSGQPAHPHHPLVAGDFDADNYTTNASTGTLNTSTFSTSGYNTLSISPGQINKTGFTKLLLLSSRDQTMVQPQSGVDEYFTIYSSEQGAGYIPELVVVYS